MASIKSLRGGTLVEFTSHDGQILSGEVLFSDEASKCFVLQKPSKLNEPDTVDVYLFPHDSIKDLRIIKQTNNMRYPEIDLEKVNQRKRFNLRFEQERLKLFEAGVSKDVRDLFDDLSKTLSTSDRLQVRWKKPFIHVLESTIIKPPYNSESVNEKGDSAKAKTESDYVRKLVDKFYSERKKA